MRSILFAFMVYRWIPALMYNSNNYQLLISMIDVKVDSIWENICESRAHIFVLYFIANWIFL